MLQRTHISISRIQKSLVLLYPDFYKIASQNQKVAIFTVKFVSCKYSNFIVLNSLLYNKNIRYYVNMVKYVIYMPIFAFNYWLKMGKPVCPSVYRRGYIYAVLYIFLVMIDFFCTLRCTHKAGIRPCWTKNETVFFKNTEQLKTELTWTAEQKLTK